MIGITPPIAGAAGIEIEGIVGSEGSFKLGKLGLGIGSDGIGIVNVGSVTDFPGGSVGIVMEGILGSSGSFGSFREGRLGMGIGRERVMPGTEGSFGSFSDGRLGMGIGKAGIGIR
jgi:hypothetical protein